MTSAVSHSSICCVQVGILCLCLLPDCRVVATGSFLGFVVIFPFRTLSDIIYQSILWILNLLAHHRCSALRALLIRLYHVSPTGAIFYPVLVEFPISAIHEEFLKCTIQKIGIFDFPVLELFEPFLQFVGQVEIERIILLHERVQEPSFRRHLDFTLLPSVYHVFVFLDFLENRNEGGRCAYPSLLELLSERVVCGFGGELELSFLELFLLDSYIRTIPVFRSHFRVDLVSYPAHIPVEYLGEPEVGYFVERELEPVSGNVSYESYFIRLEIRHHRRERSSVYEVEYFLVCVLRFQWPARWSI